MSNQNKQLYIVISQTGTLLSRILKQITGAEYNHASISLSRDLERFREDVLFWPQASL